MPLLSVQRVSKTYRSRDQRPRPALDDLSLEVEPGEFAVVLGPSGCGKTTLLRLISGLDSDYTGRINMPDLRVGFVFQEPRLLPWMTAADNVRFALAGTNDAGSHARGWLARVGLAAVASSYPHQLSIGMQQRVALARAFAVRPQLLLLDEPFSALDEITAHHVAEQLRELWQAERPTVLMVTHRVEEAVTLATRVWVLTAGPARVWTSVEVALGRSRPEAVWAMVEHLRSVVREAAAASMSFAR